MPAPSCAGGRANSAEEEVTELTSASRPRVGAIVVAAGRSSRMGGVDKTMLPLFGRPLLSYSLETLDRCVAVTAIVLVAGERTMENGRRLVEQSGWRKVREVCVGGVRRQDSVRQGLASLPDMDWIVVHDGARPCLDAGLVERGLLEARDTGAAVAAVPVRDTIKAAEPDGLVSRTVARDGLWAVQTPQVFRWDLLAAAHLRVSQDVTDDASMLEMDGVKVKLFMGAYDNIKVAAPQDVPIAEAILSSRERRDPASLP